MSTDERAERSRTFTDTEAMDKIAEYLNLPGEWDGADVRSLWPMSSLPPDERAGGMTMTEGTGANKVIKVTARHCMWCHKTLRKTWQGYGYNGEGLFCTLRCGYDYGCGAVRSAAGQ